MRYVLGNDAGKFRVVMELDAALELMVSENLRIMAYAETLSHAIALHSKIKSEYVKKNREKRKKS